MNRKTDIINHQTMPSDGTDVKSTKMLTGLGELRPEQTESNSTKQYNTGAFPSTGPHGARAKRN